jgi:hypothetical protein
MAIIANTVTFAAGVPKRSLGNLNGLAGASAVIRCWIVSPIGLKIGDTTNVSTVNGLPIIPLQVNLFEFAAANVAGDNVSIVREATGPDVVIHIMTEV